MSTNMESAVPAGIDWERGDETKKKVTETVGELGSSLRARSVLDDIMDEEPDGFIGDKDLAMVTIVELESSSPSRSMLEDFMDEDEDDYGCNRDEDQETGNEMDIGASGSGDLPLTLSPFETLSIYGPDRWTDNDDRQRLWPEDLATLLGLDDLDLALDGYVNWTLDEEPRTQQDEFRTVNEESEALQLFDPPIPFKPPQGYKKPSIEEYVEPVTPLVPAQLLLKRVDTPPMGLPMGLPEVTPPSATTDLMSMDMEPSSNPLQHVYFGGETAEFNNPLHTRDNDINNMLDQLELAQEQDITAKVPRYINPKVTVTVPDHGSDDTISDMEDLLHVQDHMILEGMEYWQHWGVEMDDAKYDLMRIRAGERLMSNTQFSMFPRTPRHALPSSPLAGKGKVIESKTNDYISTGDTTEEESIWGTVPVSPPSFPGVVLPAEFFRKHSPGEYLATQRQIIKSSVACDEAIRHRSQLQRKLQHLEEKIGEINDKAKLGKHTNEVVSRMKRWNEKTLDGETGHLLSDEEIGERCEEEAEDGEFGCGFGMMPLLDQVFYEKMVLKAQGENERVAGKEMERKQRAAQASEEVKRERERKKREEFSARSKRMEEEWRIRCEKEDRDEGLDMGVNGEEVRRSEREGKGTKRGRGLEGGEDLGKRVRRKSLKVRDRNLGAKTVPVGSKVGEVKAMW